MAESRGKSDSTEYAQQFETKRNAWVKESEHVRKEEIEKLRYAANESGTSAAGDGVTININSFTQARIDEMVSIADCLSAAVGGRRVFQTLPPHMRRRAMSHNPKRVPRRIREAHQREVEKHEKATPSKRPSRKHRRRPKNLLEEYNRRKQNHVWLETHIWHAKRFKMDRHWGYNIPIHPRDKGVRASHRAVAEGTLMQDISFYNCIELNGFQEEIVSAFRHMTNTASSLSPGAKLFLDGSRQGSGILYHNDTYPYAAIGPYQFLWKCISGFKDVDTSSVKRTMWVWVHPACHDEVVKEFESVFSLRRLSASKRPHPDAADSTIKRATKKIRLVNKDTKTQIRNVTSCIAKEAKDDPSRTVQNVDATSVAASVPLEGSSSAHGNNGYSQLMTFSDRTPVYASATMTMVLLKDTLVRLRLRGPQCIATLAGVLKPAKCDSEDNKGDSELQSVIKSEPTLNWWQRYYGSRSHLSMAQTQNEVWEKIQKEVDFSQLPSNCVLGLTVRDPRLLLPSKRTLAICNSAHDPAQAVFINFPPDVSSSPLWDAAIRDEVTYKRVDLATLNRMRAQSLIPGIPLELGSQESRIPVLLVQIPGARMDRNVRPGYGSGFDLILPSAWGMAFWIALVYNGARTSGMREAESTELQQGSLVFPNHFPDTAAGRSYEKAEEARLLMKYERRPPAKRVNFPSLGIVAPFSWPWLQLIQEWAALISPSMPSITDFYVLRQGSVLRELQALCCNRQPQKKSSIVFRNNCLVGVRLEMIGRGTAQAHGIICLPKAEDIKGLLPTPEAKLNLKWDLKESHKVNPLAKEHKEHRVSVRVLRQKRKKFRQKVRTKKAAGESDVAVQHLDEQLAWLHPKPMPLLPDVTQVVKSCDRDVIGFVSAGEFSYSLGQVSGLGYCAMAPLNQVFELILAGKRPLVLVRETCSDHYRAAWLSIMLT